MEKRLMEAAMQARKQEVTDGQSKLDAILTKDAFVRACQDATSFELQPAVTQGILTSLITDAEEEFKMAMELDRLDLQRRAAKEQAAASARAAAKERRAMEMDQVETDVAISKVVQEQLEKRFPQLLKKHQQAVRFNTRSAPRRREPSPAQRHGRGRSPSRGWERAPARRQTPARGPHARAQQDARAQHAAQQPRPRSASRAQVRAPARTHTPARGRPSAPRGQQRSARQSREPPRGDNRQRTPRSTSRPHSRPQINRQGGRGARPHRSPSAWHGGGGRSGGGSASRMAARR